MKIEVANLCAEIETKDYREDGLKTRFRPFLTQDGSPYFKVIIKKGIPSGLNPDLIESTDRIKITRRKGEFFVFRDIPPRLEIGWIDERDRICQFNNYAQILTEALFNTFLKGCFQVFLCQMDGFLLHSCGVVSRGEGHLFPGGSGSGKTTVASLSRGRTILSDDLVAIRRMEKFYIYGTPWYGMANRRALLRMIFFLKKSSRLCFRKVKRVDAIGRLLSAVRFSGILDGKIVNCVMDTVEKMVRETPCYEMCFTRESDIWKRIEGLGGEGDRLREKDGR